MTPQLCKCGCLEPVEKRSYETAGQWRKREESGFAWPQCKKRGAAPVDRDRPSLVADPTAWDHSPRKAGGPIPKPSTPRDPKFLKWLSKRPCQLRGGRFGNCQGDVVGHHTNASHDGGMGNKGSDYDAISVCHIHHLLFDNASKRGNGILTGGQLEVLITHNKFDWITEGHTLKEPR